MRNETQKEMEEGLKWAKKKLARIEQYEKEGRMPETCSQKLPLEVIAKVYKNILSNPLDEQRELWERSLDLAYKQI